MDGEPAETFDNHLVDAPVALFERSSFEAQVRRDPGGEFLPDIVFHSLRRHDYREKD